MAPSSGPERMSNLECAGGDGGYSDQLDADDGRKRDVTERENAGGDHHDAQEYADPDWGMMGVTVPVLPSQAVTPSSRGYPFYRFVRDRSLEQTASASDETLSEPTGLPRSGRATLERYSTDRRPRESSVRLVTPAARFKPIARSIDSGWSMIVRRDPPIRTLAPKLGPSATFALAPT